MHSRDGDPTTFKLLGLVAFGLSVAVFVLLAFLGTAGISVIA
jgi:hypothetical protein